MKLPKSPKFGILPSVAENPEYQVEKRISGLKETPDLTFRE